MDSCKLSFSYSRIPEPGTSTARHPPCQQNAPQKADSANNRFSTLVTVGIPSYLPTIRDALLFPSRSRLISRSTTHKSLKLLRSSSRVVAIYSIPTIFSFRPLDAAERGVFGRRDVSTIFGSVRGC